MRRPRGRAVSLLPLVRRAATPEVHRALRRRPRQGTARLALPRRAAGPLQRVGRVRREDAAPRRRCRSTRTRPRAWRAFCPRRTRRPSRSRSRACTKLLRRRRQPLDAVGGDRVRVLDADGPLAFVDELRLEREGPPSWSGSWSPRAGGRAARRSRGRSRARRRKSAPALARRARRRRAPAKGRSRLAPVDTRAGRRPRPRAGSCAAKSRARRAAARARGRRARRSACNRRARPESTMTGSPRASRQKRWSLSMTRGSGQRPPEGVRSRAAQRRLGPARRCRRAARR